MDTQESATRRSQPQTHGRRHDADGHNASPQTVRYWWNRFGPLFAAEIRKRRVHRHWYSNWRGLLDEVFVRINGKTCYLWRAVDHEGEVLER